MKWIALFLLLLVACTLPQPNTDDKSLDVEKEPEVKVEETSETPEEVGETIIKTEDEIKTSEDTVEVKTDEKKSPITGGVTAIDEEFAQKAFIGEPPKKELLAVGIDNVMDFLVEVYSKNVESYSF